jgi:Ca2+-binding RTX toxin-like protein
MSRTMSFVTGNIAIDALVYSSWNSNPGTPLSLTYSFLSAPPTDASSEDRDGFAPMTSVQRQAARDALKLWSQVANITFTEVSSGGKLQFGTNQQSNSSGYAYLPEPGVSATQMYLDKDAPYNQVYTTGSYGPSVMLHEIGHMLGLKHPGNYDSSGSTAEGPYLPADQDNGDYTQMSYTPPTMYQETGKYAATPMLYDVLAMQYLYGANKTFHGGDDVYSFGAAEAPRCIWDAGGTNTFDFSACTGQVTIDLRPGGFSSTVPGYHNIALAYGVTVTRAVAGNFGSQIYSSSAGSVITGGAGADTVYLGSGNDTVSGGAGADSAVFANSFASYSVQRNTGGVTVLGEGSDKLDGVETLVFSDRSVKVADLPLQSAVQGTSGNDRIVALAGSETIDGGAGRDTVVLAGLRAGYTVHASGAGFTVADNAGSGGTDWLLNVEKLHFTDQDVSFEISGAAGQAYRLYQATFDRVPDLAGLGFWVGAMEGGVTLEAAAASFIKSAEFTATYGGVDNRTFANLLYLHTLHRAPDAAGLDWWSARLDEGAARSSVLAAFSESPENQAQVIGAIADGVNFIPYQAG